MTVRWRPWLPPRSRRNASAGLLGQNAIAPQDADDARAAYLQAKAAADTARINLNYTHIAAAISGRIGASSVTEGALVTANQGTDRAGYTISTPRSHSGDVDQSSSELASTRRAGQSAVDPARRRQGDAEAG